MWQRVTDTHAVYKQQLLRSYRSSYNKWFFQLTNGFNLLFYGVGSKRELLTDFAEHVVASLHIPLVVLNGYEPLVLKQVKEVLAQHQGSRRCILVHSIDGTSLRSSNAVLSLTEAVANADTCLIASMDHINTPLCMTSVAAFV